MSTSKNKKTYAGAIFSDVWKRLEEETDIKYLKDLGKLVGVTQQNVSIKKQENLFPYGWAIPVSRKYNLLPEWILTGEGPKSLKNVESSQYNFEIIRELDQWLKELVENEPYRKDWFKGNLEDAFPRFREWRQRKEQEENNSSIFPGKNVA